MTGTKQRGYSLFLFLFALYLLTYAPTFDSSDGLAMFSTAESLVRRGAWDIEQIRWLGLQQGTYGLDGLLYSRKGLGQPLLALPLTWLGLTIPIFGPATTTMLFGSLITASTGLLVYLLLRHLAYADQTALLTALVYGTGTLAWPYAKSFFSDPLAGFLLLAATLALIRLNQTGRGRYAFLAGLCLAWSVATRYAAGVFLPVFGLLLLAYLQQRSSASDGNDIFNLRALISNPRAFLAPIALFTLPILLVGLGLMIFNLRRYGDPLNTGYLPEENFSGIWWQGILGQLISPGRGLLLYSPILLISFFGLKTFWQRHRLEALACIAVIMIHLLLYGKWFMWHGGFAWGPRFMIPTLPFWVLLMAPVLDRLSARPVWRFGFYGLWLLSIFVQLPGVAVDFDLWQNQLLTTGLPLFAPVTFFASIYSPLVGTWQYLNQANLNVAWVVDGQIMWSLLGVLLLNFGLTGWLMLRQFNPGGHQSIGRGVCLLTGLITLLTTAWLLFHVHQAQPSPLLAAIDQINDTPAPLVYNNPEFATIIAELYRGRHPVLGLFAPEPDRLAEFITSRPILWWLPTGRSEIEDQLLENYAMVQRETYGNQDLGLFIRSDGPSQTLNARFDEVITLHSVRLSAQPRPKAPLAVELDWQADQTPTASYHVFLHLLDSTGTKVAQADGQPVHWSRPTTSWQPGETIVDHYALRLPDLPPGHYTLIGGLYQPETGQRLTTSNNTDSVQLGSILLK